MAALERIDILYREPLVLFYREHQSIENVALALELSEDAVKQRLSRGRKLLEQEVTSFVAGALQRTTPGKAFTVAVLAALPVTLTGSAKAATLGAAAAKGALAAKTAAGMGFLSALISPVMSVSGPGFNIELLSNMPGRTRSGRPSEVFTKGCSLLSWHSVFWWRRSLSSGKISCAATCCCLPVY